MGFRNRIVAALFPKGYSMVLQQTDLQKNINALKAQELTLNNRISEKKKQLELIEFKRQHKPKFKKGAQIRDMKILSMKPIYLGVIDVLMLDKVLQKEFAQSMFNMPKIKMVQEQLSKLTGFVWQYEVDIRGVVKHFTEQEFIQVVTDGPEPRVD